ncbi:type I polyketide synthase [Chengkuizengella marina]|nr:type I polyketide synthase [Chengkuizengella marina]
MCANDIAIIGMAGRFPQAENIDQFWNNLMKNKDCITRWESKESSNDEKEVHQYKELKSRGILNNIDQFDAAFFDVSFHEAEMLDPQHRLFLECVWQALENAGYDITSYDGIASLYAACGKNTYIDAVEGKASTPAEIFQQYTTNGADFLPTRVAYKLNLKGESIAIQTACSSSLVAVHMACQSLLSGNSDLAIAGGVHIAIPEKKGYLYQEGMIFSPDGYCRPFDHRSKGQVDGNGLGVVVLKKLEEALSDGDFIYAVIKGSAVNNDGNDKAGYSAPSVSGQAEVIATALGMADISAESISYVEAHASATPLGDPIEVKGLSQAFSMFTDKKQFCAIGSVKSSIGHLNHASGIAGLIKTVLSLHHGKIPATVHYEKPNPAIDFEHSPFYVCGENTNWESDGPRRAGVSSFGIGGTNAHVVLEQAPEKMTSVKLNNSLEWITLSAKSQEALTNMKRNLKEAMEHHPTMRLEDIAYTLNTGRAVFAHRWAALVRNKDELIQALSDSEQPSKCFVADDAYKDEAYSNMIQQVDRWLNHHEVDWNAFYTLDQRSRVPLPSYPFERESYWLTREKKLEHKLESEMEINDWFYIPTWEKSSATNKEVESLEAFRNSCWIVFANEDQFSNELIDRLTHAGISVIKVLHGKTFMQMDRETYYINPTASDHYQKLMTALGEDITDNINHMFYLWSYAEQVDSSFEGTVSKDYLSVLYLIQSLEQKTSEVTLWVITSDAQAVAGGNQCWSIEKSVLFGLCKVIPQELDYMRTRAIDFTKAEHVDLHIDQLCNELLFHTSDSEVVYRGANRLVPAYKQISLSKPNRESVPIRQKGTYLITGGLGKMGLTLAEFLAKEYQANLILTSRSGFPSLEGEDHPTAVHRVNQLEKIKNYGSKVVVKKADAANRNEMESCLNDIHQEFGALHGVIHAAGAADSRYFRFINETTEDIVDEVLSSKVQGTLILADLLKGVSIDFVLNCSSLSPLLGGLTFAAYAAANRFQDEFSVYQQHHRFQPWISVNWDTWKFPVQKSDFGAAILETSIKPEAGVLAFQRVLTLNTSRVVVSTIPLNERIRKVEESLTVRRKQDKEEVVASTNLVFDRDTVQSIILNIYSSFFGNSSVAVDDDFFTLGGTSLEVLHLLSDAEQQLGIKIPLDLGFKALTPQLLTELCISILEEKAKQNSEKKYVYEVDIDGEIAIFTVTESDYHKYGLPEGAKNLRVV